MRRMNKTSIALRDGSGYIGYLEFVHMLHCVVSDPLELRRIQLMVQRNASTSLNTRGIITNFRALAPSHPLIGVSKDTSRSCTSCSHIPVKDHCLEVLRRGIMCSADVTVNTYSWKNPEEIKGDSSWPRKCTDWESIQVWADERAVEYVGNDDFVSILVPSHDTESLGPREHLSE